MIEMIDMTDMTDTIDATDPSRGSPLELDSNLVLAAGAGSGKTHALVSVALGLYVGVDSREPCDPTRVWAVTFTEKAARELRQRIVERAGALAADPIGALANEPELAAMLGAREVPAARWRAIVEQLAAAPIGTFHSLCGQLLRGFAVEAGVDPSFGVLDENDANELFARVLDEVLLRDLDASVDSHTRAAARALGGPDILRAGLRRLHAKLGEEGRDPESLLIDADGRSQPGFDRAAAAVELELGCRELAASLELLARSDEDRLRPTIRTLAIERGRIGGCEPEQLHRWYPALVRVASQRRGKGTLPKRARRVWEPVTEAWTRVQDAVAAIAEQDLAGRVLALLDEVSRAYAAEKRRLEQLDFVDLVRGAHDLLRDDRLVRAQVKRRVEVLLVDEFQDTNGLQLDLVHLLAEARDHERAVAPGVRASAVLPLGHRCFAAVGDRKQSIYEFRGADVSLFQALAGRALAGADGLRLHALRRSWRSRPGLVAVANTLFARLLIRDEPAGSSGFAVEWIDEVDQLEPVREDHPSQRGLPTVQLLLGDPNDDTRTRRASEARRLARHVELLLEAAPPLGRTDGHGQPGRLRGADVAILMRTHGHVARYRKALSEVGVASIVVGGRGFFAAREVRELAVLLLAIADPRDSLASAGVWRSPIWGIGDDAIVELAAAEQLRIADHFHGCTIELDPRDAASVTQMARLIDRLHHELDRLGPAPVLRFAIDRLGVREVLAWDEAGEQRIANVDKLLALLGSREFAGLGAIASARRLLERGEDLLDREAPAEVAAAADPNAVRIMTIHAAKGLEFPVVIVPELGAEPRGQEGPVLFERELGLAVISPDLVGRRRPSAHAVAVTQRLAARRDAESRRLLYVAATRARDLLVLLGESPSARATGQSDNWRALIDSVLPDLAGAIEIVDAGPVTQAQADPAETPMRWLLDRVDAVRRAATAKPEPEAAVPPSIRADPLGPPDADDPPRSIELESHADLVAALARSEPLELRDCELEISLAGFAEFDMCPRRYLLTHVVGLDTPAAEQREPFRGLQLLPFVPRRVADEHELGDVPTPTRTEARSRGRLVHHTLGRIDLDRFGHDPRAALDQFVGTPTNSNQFVGTPTNSNQFVGTPAELWDSVRDDLIRLGDQPWIAELIAAHRHDPRRVLRSLPFVLELAPLSAGRVIVRGRIDLVYVDDAGRLNLVDWQYGTAPAESGATLDPGQLGGFRRLTQALALRRLWGPEIPVCAGAVYLREHDPVLNLAVLDPETLAGFEARLHRTATRLLAVELDNSPRAPNELWPKLAHPSACGGCVHIGRCWRGEHTLDVEPEPEPRAREWESDPASAPVFEPPFHSEYDLEYEPETETALDHDLELDE